MASFSDTCNDMVAQVADFGLARQTNAGSRVETQSCGTLTAMPPELITQDVMSKARHPGLSQTLHVIKTILLNTHPKTAVQRIMPVYTNLSQRPAHVPFFSGCWHISPA